MSAYAEMAAASNFSFLRGASRPRDLVLTAVALGLSGLGIADRNTVAGTARAWAALRSLREDGLTPPDRVRWGGGPGEVDQVPNPLEDAEVRAEIQHRAQGFRLALGTRLAFTDGTPDILAYPETRTGWGRLCRLLTKGNLRGRKGECLLQLSDLEADTEGLLLIVMPPRGLDGLDDCLARVARAAPGAAWLGATALFGGDDRRRLMQLARLAEQAGTPLIATNDVLYHAPGQRDLQDVLTCIREGVSIDHGGPRLEANAERHLKPARRNGAAVSRPCPRHQEGATCWRGWLHPRPAQIRISRGGRAAGLDASVMAGRSDLAARRHPLSRDGVPNKVRAVAARGAAPISASSIYAPIS
jgi:error-prone DNA polymerase